MLQIDEKTTLPGGELKVTGWGNLPTPYDLLIATNQQGSNDGIVQRVQFTLSANADLDESLLNCTSWFIRLQITNNGQQSARTLGTVHNIPTCGKAISGPPVPSIDAVPSNPTPPNPTAPNPPLKMGLCSDPLSLVLEGGQNITLTDLNTCNVLDSNSGFLENLEGRDFVIYLEASSGQRDVTLTTSASAAGPSFDTFLVACIQCTKNHTLSTVVTFNDDAEGLGTFSSLTFSAESDTPYYLILSGFEDACGWADLNIKAALPPSPPAPVPPGADGPLGSCSNPQSVNITDNNGERFQMEVDTCSAGDANGWDGESLALWNLQGKDFVLLLLPQPVPRTVTAQTAPTSSDERYDTYLMATKQCGGTRSSGQLVADGDDNGEGKLSAVTWTIPPNEEHFLVVEGYGDTCGKSDVIITATTASPPPSPSPPSAPPSPSPPPVCLADRASAPNRGRRYVCATFNDPHIYHFFGGFTTCNTKGSMLLLSNEFFNITATAVSYRWIQTWSEDDPSVIQSLSITYKNPACGESAHFDARHLPRVWGPEAVWRDDVLATEVRLWTRGSYSFGDFFNIQIRTPWTEGSGACLGECSNPARSWRRWLLQKDGEVEAEAIKQCTERGLSGGFLDACIFDAASTGDVKTFVEASAETQENSQIASAEVEEENEEYMRRTFAPNAPTPPAPATGSLPREGSDGAGGSPPGRGGSGSDGSDSGEGQDAGSGDVMIEPAPDPGPGNEIGGGSNSSDATLEVAVGVAVGGAAVLAVSLAAVWYLRSRKHRRQGLDNQIAEDHYLAKTQGLHGGHHDPRRHGNMQGSGRIWNKTNTIVPDPYALPCAPYPHHPPPEVLEPATPTPSSPGDSNRHQPAFEVRPKARTAWLKGASPQTSRDLSSPSSSLSSPFQPSSTPAAVDRGLSSSFTSEQGSQSQSRPAKPIQLDLEDCIDDPRAAVQSDFQPCFFPMVRGAAPKPSAEAPQHSSPVHALADTYIPPLQREPPSLQLGRTGSFSSPERAIRRG
ncbi:hypothetical protein DUNSADRAFT_5812 [Dunaliella salina]|uniref:Repulsive guidance molecule C-terminal domain-containing protein n=1 Tax=Dunaliella salina TaxID=3046 RepID=A0ABQ7GPJ3_DUNSA|nr:hypothetical protein DUNSADRAFT_5812 [Dunaliella salina]|eukprot:KAF5836524.1 hypothetical protein DUNSADRAFT_5812 [Dunaliella salina]